MVQEQPSRVGRRLSAIVAADVAGYSRLMGLDEAGTARILREHRAVTDALVTKHGGRIVKTTCDGVLIEFGSAVGAVQCAIALQRLTTERNAGSPATAERNGASASTSATYWSRAITSLVTGSTLRRDLKPGRTGWHLHFR